MPKAESLVVTRLRNPGTLIIGKTNMPEFGTGSHAYNKVYGTTVNPYDVTKSAGGSSGGADAALAASLLSISNGSDLSGSLCLLCLRSFCIRLPFERILTFYRRKLLYISTCSCLKRDQSQHGDQRTQNCAAGIWNSRGLSFAENSRSERHAWKPKGINQFTMRLVMCREWHPGGAVLEDRQNRQCRPRFK
jgi:hypothetical protein